MTRAETFIAGDWGTSHLRLFLCEGEHVLERRTGPGAGQLAHSPEAFGHTLAELTRSWTRLHGTIPVRLSGMAGARTGWREAPYLQCPADVSSVAAAMLRFDFNGQPIALSPGVSCINPRGAPDVMRGEETQIFGALAHSPAFGTGRQVFGLPGTHTKWALIEEGRILSFQTSLAGEFFALLRDHSSLLLASKTAQMQADADTSFDDNAFEWGVQRAREHGKAPLHHVVFEARSRQLMEGISSNQALAFLSGLIIGQDVAGALDLLTQMNALPACVPLIGSPHLTQLYRKVFQRHGIDTAIIDASDATLRGLQAYHAWSNHKESLRAPVA